MATKQINPTGIQLDELRRYAAENGRNWKSKLLDDWTNARTVGPLQEVRNQFGPSWLLKHGTKAIQGRDVAQLVTEAEERIEARVSAAAPALLRAALVITKTAHIWDYLRSHDPKALEQVERAIAQAIPGEGR